MAAAAILSGCDKHDTPPVKDVEVTETVTVSPDGVKTVESEIAVVPENFKDTDIAASVNGNQITWKELNDKVNAIIAASAKSPRPIPEDKIEEARDYFRKQLIEQFISVNMFRDEAKRLNLTVTDATREEAIKKINENIAQREPGKTIEQVFEEYPMGAETARKDFEDQLLIEELFKKEVTEKAQVSDEEVKQRVDEATVIAEEANKKFADAEKLIKDGTPFEDVVKDFSVVKDELKLPKEQLSKIDPAVAEAVTKLEPGKISEKIESKNGLAIVKLVKTVPAIDKAAAKAKIEEIREKIVNGGDFAALAAEYSTCPSGKKGGDLGTFSRGQMVPEFDKAAFEQEIGVVGPVIETQFGYHIVKVTEKKSAGDPPAETVTASHILVGEAPESVDLYLLLVPSQPVPTADSIREEIKMQKSRATAETFREDVRKRTTITAIYPELAK